MKLTVFRWISLSLVVVLTGVFGVMAQNGNQPQAKVEFTRSSIDFGIVCGDVKKSAAFYRDVVGLTELEGFDVDGDLGAKIGLTDKQPFHVHVLAASNSPEASKVKLMEFKDAPGAAVNNKFIHSSLGMSYSTIWIADINAALERIQKHKAKVVSDGAVDIGNGLFLITVLDPDSNFIELVGPKK